MGSTKVHELVLYSPAPPSILLHEQNEMLGAQLGACGLPNTVVPVALPESVNRISEMSAEVRAYHLPIVTTLDFLPAVNGTGPDWHHYEKANNKLRFVAALYEVAFGVLVFDESIRSPEHLIGKRIAAPPRPSAVRWYTETLLRDGWGIIDDVEIVDMRPEDLPRAVAEKAVDATTWILLSETQHGYEPLLPPLFELPSVSYIGMTATVAERINDVNDFKIGLVTVTDVHPANSDAVIEVANLLSFRQALAAWDETPPHIVQEILQCISTENRSIAEWPQLRRANIHPAALQYFETEGYITF